MKSKTGIPFERPQPTIVREKLQDCVLHLRLLEPENPKEAKELEATLFAVEKALMCARNLEG